MSKHSPPLEISNREAWELASRIQSTIISNTLTLVRWEEHIVECRKFHFQAAMVPPAWVKRTAEALRGTGIKVASFVDFPYGTMTSTGKTYETAQLVQNGAEEVDLMPNVGFLLSGMEREYAEDIRGVVRAAGNIPVKIMLELPLLNAQQKERAVALSVDSGVAYLKNASSGAVGVATPEQIAFLRRLAPPPVRVKASGGIKTAQQVRDLVRAGADVVGTSSGAQIMGELQDGPVAPDRDFSQY
ncbi:MAG: deoxyribose-phosphate aldolase [Candidatus Sulfotelmatobacter sp.]